MGRLGYWQWLLCVSARLLWMVIADVKKQPTVKTQTMPGCKGFWGKSKRLLLSYLRKTPVMSCCMAERGKHSRGNRQSHCFKLISSDTYTRHSIYARTSVQNCSAPTSPISPSKLPSQFSILAYVLRPLVDHPCLGVGMIRLTSGQHTALLEFSPFFSRSIEYSVHRFRPKLSKR